MPCSCKESERNDNGVVAPSKEPANRVSLKVVVRAEGNPLACDRCLEKHLAKALVYACEAQEADRPVERALARANLSCAAEHADALGRNVEADKIAALSSISLQVTSPREIRSLLPGGGDPRETAVGRLGAAEDALRFIGKNDLADRIRAVRLELMEKTLESQRVAGVENKAEPARTEEH